MIIQLTLRLYTVRERLFRNELKIQMDNMKEHLEVLKQKTY